jgi:hypothetical protein
MNIYRHRIFLLRCILITLLYNRAQGVNYHKGESSWPVHEQCNVGPVAPSNDFEQDADAKMNNKQGALAPRVTQPNRRTFMSSPQLSVAAVALAALTLLVSCRNAEDATPAEMRPVRVLTIETRAIGDTVALTGTVQAQTEINQSFRIDGRLIERAVDVGDTVQPGQLLARLDPQNEESGLQAAGAIGRRTGATGRGTQQSPAHERPGG